ncbi:BlaI/MecI/CopY family transcriptional regulator [Candidatus Latescibacterota bacterium]
MGLRKSRLFTEGELDFMKVLWGLGEAIPEEIQKALHKFGRKLTGGTIRNVLVVMIEKGYVTRRKKGKVYLYKAKVSEDQAKKFMLQDLLEKAFGGSESHMVATLLKNSEVRKEEMDEIKRLIVNQKKGGKK